MTLDMVPPVVQAIAGKTFILFTQWRVLIFQRMLLGLASALVIAKRLKCACAIEYSSTRQL